MVREIAAGIALYTVAVGLFGLVVFGSSFMGSVLVGGALTYFNYLWLAGLVKGLLIGGGSPRRFAVVLALKGLALMGAVGALVALKLVEALPFIVGLSGLFVSVFLAGIRWQVQAPGRGADRGSGSDGPEI